MSNNDLVSTFITYYSSYVNQFGVKNNGEEVKAPDSAKTDDEKKEYLRNNVRNVKQLSDLLVNDPEDGVQARFERLQKYEALFK